ncbi:tRNA lysidine(34) synthetase TilS [Sphingomicrobium marinum]|uniref:tRNA lysidine(34) synthetase TilS n=1 Tax=Sphingomicrobium marinum TaxID=1227950 RepID=UPI0022400180|nr:tRNA lysidine(34) synthetase TilS [Sphingomicrobium marinum]
MSKDLMPDQVAVDRFSASLDRLVPTTQAVGLAVSGGPDSLALLLLANAARPGMVQAVTVDHALRSESAQEAKTVAAICLAHSIPHTILKAEWGEGVPDANIEAAARKMRYAMIGNWAERNELAFVATAHHADDQAETLLMRLARGAGLSGLSGIRERRPLGDKVTLVRPLLDWEKVLLMALVMRAGLPVANDPMNDDDRFDRVQLRTALKEGGFGDARQYANSARHLQQADEALQWLTATLAQKRLVADRDGLVIDTRGLPDEVARRLLLAGFDRLGDRSPRGPDLERAMARLKGGGKAILGKLLVEMIDGRWHLTKAPPRKTV